MITSSGLELPGAKLSLANLEKAILLRTNLQGANLILANLQGAFLYAAELQRADLREADLNGADLQDAILIKANLRGAKNLDKAILKDAIYNDETTFPEDFDPEAHNMIHERDVPEEP